MRHTRTILTDRHRRRVIALGAVGALAAASLVASLPASADPDPAHVGLFQLEGNVVDDGAGDDWASLWDPNPGVDDDTDDSTPKEHDYTPNSAFTATGIVADPAPNSIFTGGGSKDGLDIPGWLHKDGSVPDKDDITNAYAAAYSDDDDTSETFGDTFVYFGMDRLTTEGSANVGFWFLQDEEFGLVPGNPIGRTSDFKGEHVARDEGAGTPGDVLILSEFDSGGSNPHIKVFEWVGSGGDEGGGTLDTIFGGSNGAEQACGDPAETPICASVNDLAIDGAGTGDTIPWPYESKKDKGKPVFDMPIASFFEGGINLSALFDTTPCFSDMVAETRSSFETSAVLKDLVAAEFELCGADISITPDGVNDVGATHTFIVKLNTTNAGAQTAAVDGTDVDVTITDAGGNEVPSEDVVDGCATVVDGDVTTGGTVDGECTVEFTSSVTGTFTAHAAAAAAIGTTSIDVETGGDNNPDATKIFVDAKISITPDDVNGIGEPHTFTVLVEEDRGDGNGFVPATAGHVDVRLSPTAPLLQADIVKDLDASTCDNSGDNLAGEPVEADDPEAGTCTIVFKSDVAGVVTGHARVAVFIDVNGDATSDITVPRRTDGATDYDSENSVDAVKEYVDGTLTWIKHDDEGALLPGATFSVCHTRSYDSSGDGSFVDIVDTDPGPVDSRCQSVEDDVEPTDDELAGDTVPDADSVGGLFKLLNLYLGTYTITETVAPDGYALDPDTETVNLTVDEPVGEPTMEVDEVTVPKPFIDPALFKIIVLTCNTTTDELVDSTVNLDVDADPETDDRTATLVDEALNALCDTGGAVYDDLPRGTYDLEVELPDRGDPFPVVVP